MASNSRIDVQEKEAEVVSQEKPVMQQSHTDDFEEKALILEKQEEGEEEER